MFRLLPLLALALLPAAGAAPVPPGGRVEFGRNGLLTRADLEKVRFGSRPLNDNDKLRKQVAENNKPRQGFEKAAVAVHMPWHTFREGEPIPAYFIFKNSGDQPLGLDARLDMFGPYPITWNSCSISVIDRETNKPVEAFGGGGWMCGGPPLVVVPANGFYCVKGDIGRVGEGKRLPPGEYEVDWRYSWMRSAPVKFTVVKNDGAKLPIAKRLGAHFFRLSPDTDRERCPAKVGEPFLWPECDLESADGGEMAAALAVGHKGLYVPDILDIPAADKFVEVSVQWKPYREGDRVAVTFQAVDPRKPVRFSALPELHLQAECDSEKLRSPLLEEPAKAKAVANAGKAMVTPLTIEACLPRDWRERSGVKGTARVAVLVASERIELPRAQWNENELKSDSLDNNPSRWSGVLRTPFVELRFPDER